MRPKKVPPDSNEILLRCWSLKIENTCPKEPFAQVRSPLTKWFNGSLWGSTMTTLLQVSDSRTQNRHFPLCSCAALFWARFTNSAFSPMSCTFHSTKGQVIESHDIQELLFTGYSSSEQIAMELPMLCYNLLQHHTAQTLLNIKGIKQTTRSSKGFNSKPLVLKLWAGRFELGWMVI